MNSGQRSLGSERRGRNLSSHPLDTLPDETHDPDLAALPSGVELIKAHFLVEHSEEMLLSNIDIRPKA
jgi:hypothetical protein